LDAIELPPFRAAIEEAAPAIMTAHVLLPALDEERPATLSPAVLQGLLREDLGYDGLIVTDSLGMGALTQRYGPAEIGLLAFQAGADVLAYGADIAATVGDQQVAYQRILTAAESGEISPQRLDASVRRILLAKLAYGLFYHPPLDPDEAAEQTGTPAHLAVARDLAEASITLVRDENALFPPAQEGQMLVAYPASLPHFGEALATCRPDLILRPIPLNPTATDIEAIVADAAIAAQVVVATVNARRHPAQATLVNALPPERLAVVALQEPYDLLAFPHIPTYLATYGSADVSLHALARALCAEFLPTGRLPVPLPGLHAQGWRAPNGEGAGHWAFLPIMIR
jgi:beta-N-acetylhexosaminidase